MKKVITSLAMVGMIGAASATTVYVTDGEFNGDGSAWGFAAAGAVSSFPDAGGNPGGHGQIDQTAANWGAVFINDGDSPVPLGTLGLMAGATYQFTLDMKDLSAGGENPVAGMKMESWAGGGFLDNGAGDIIFDITDSWDTYTFDYTINAGADALKFVPLMVSQPVGSSVGFDNVGVDNIPEPSSLALLGLGVAGFMFRRRR